MGLGFHSFSQSMQGGLPAKTQVLWHALEREFPELKGLGAWGDRSHMARKSCHNEGMAIDAMTTDRALHKLVVQWALAHRDEYDIRLIISWRYKRSAASKWAGVPYLGVASHKDHIHLSVGCT